MELDNRQSMKYIDSTPDNEYPIRILLAYLEASKTRVSDNSAGLPINNEMCIIMNKANEEREIILREAISTLRKHMKQVSERTVYVPSVLPELDDILNTPEPQITVTKTSTRLL